MNKNIIYALVLIGLAVLVMIFNHGGSLSVDVGFGDIKAARSLVFFAFTAVGVTAGLLIK
jgi:hypothetical protein